MKKIFFLIFLFSVFFTAGDQLFLEEIGLSLWLPDSWTKTVDSDYLFAESPQKKALFHCEMLDAQTLDEALSEYPEVLSDYFSELKIEKNLRNLKLLEKETVHISASGRYEGSEMQITVYLLETEESITLLVYAADKNQLQNFNSVFEQILQSLEKKVEQKN